MTWCEVRGLKAATLVALLALSGCVKFHPRPLAPPKIEAELRSRRLPDPAVPLDLGALVGIAVESHPEIELARAQLRTAQAALVTAGARPDPSIDGDAGYSTASESAVVIDFAPSLRIETAGKRGYRILRAQKLAEVAKLRVAETAWLARSRVRAALVDYMLAQRTVDLLRSEQRIRLDAARMIQARFDVGDTGRPELDAARFELSRTAVAVKAAGGQAAAALAALAGAVGLPAAAFAEARIVWRALEAPPAPDKLPLTEVQQAGLLNRLDIRRALLEYAADEAALQLEIARQYPDIQLGPRYSFEEAHHAYAFGPSLPAPLWNRNKGPIAEAEARRTETEARFKLLEAGAIAEIDAARVRYRAAIGELAEADERLRPLQDGAEASIRRAVAAGEQDRLALAAAELQTVMAARARLDALRRAQTALTALEDAVHQPLVPESRP